MKVENFSIGGVDLAIRGESVLAGKFRDLFSFVRTEGRDVDLLFDFVEGLTPWEKGSFVPVENFLIKENCIRVIERLFTYDVYRNKKPVTVCVAENQENSFRKSKRAINKSWRYFHSHGRGLYVFSLKRFVFYIYMHILELELLKKGSSLVHCSGVERDGMVILFSAGEKVGKTSIMSKCLEKGWRFIADDSCVISEGGIAYIHPIPMHIYKYQERQNRALVAGMLEHMGFFDKLNWSLWGWLKSPAHVVRWLRPEDIFGEIRIARKGKIKSVIHMQEKRNITDFTLDKVPPEHLSHLMTNSFLDEIKNLVNSSIVLNSYRRDQFLPTVAEIYGKICDVYAKALAEGDCYQLAIPERSPAGEVYAFLERSLWS